MKLESEFSCRKIGPAPPPDRPSALTAKILINSQPAALKIYFSSATDPIRILPDNPFLRAIASTFRELNSIKDVGSSAV